MLLWKQHIIHFIMALYELVSPLSERFAKEHLNKASGDLYVKTVPGPPEQTQYSLSRFSHPVRGRACSPSQ